jgi:ABC-2 type transport system permease protein
MSSIIRRILIQLRNDKRSLALLLLAPLFILTLLYFILGDSGYVPKVTTYQINDSILESLKKDTTVTVADAMYNWKEYLEDENQDAAIWMDAEGLHIYMLDKSSKTAKVVKAIQQMNSANVFIQYEYDSNGDNQLDSLSFVFLGVLSFFFVFLLSGMSFVRERTNQTLERMLMAPLKRFSVISGYTLGYGILSTIQSIIIILFSVYVLKLHVEGSVFLCMVIMIIMSFAAVSMGALASIFAENELQLVQFIPIVIIPQIFFSGLLPLDIMPYGLGNLCFLAPAYYSCTSLQKVMIYGKGFTDVLPWLLGMLGYIAILFTLNVLALKKYRKL